VDKPIYKIRVNRLKGTPITYYTAHTAHTAWDTATLPCSSPSTQVQTTWNFQGTFCILQGTFREHSGNIQGTFSNWVLGGAACCLRSLVNANNPSIAGVCELALIRH
jgi:hypothetical protein